MTEFKINDLITLKLEGAKTGIYLNDVRFNQCKSLFLDIPISDLPKYDDASSIDEITSNYEKSGIIQSTHNLTPEVEFWGHCSNLQVWVENNYDTNLLHTNLSFPLLKKLTDLGDPIAKRVFKEEIVKRFCSGYSPVVEYLTRNRYLKYLGAEEIEVLLNNFGEFEELNLSKFNLETVPESIGNLRKLKKLTISNLELETLSESIGNLEKLEVLNLRRNRLTTLPDSIAKLNSLKVLNLRFNEIEEFPKSILGLKALQKLDISNNSLKEVPEAIVELENLLDINVRANPIVKIPDKVLILQYNVKLDHCKILLKLESTLKQIIIYTYEDEEIIGLNLSKCDINEFPKLITEIKSLKRLDLSENKFTELSDLIGKLKSLKELNISKNFNIRYLPEALWTLKTLRVLEMRWIDLEELSESIGNLTDLEILDLTYNWIQYLPESIGKLINLRTLILFANNLRDIPRSIQNLRHLGTLELTKNLLREIPEWLFELRNLKELNYEYNRIKGSRNSIWTTELKEGNY